MAAEKALTKGLHRLENKIPALKRKSSGNSLQGALVVIQPKTGHILAMVGGGAITVKASSTESPRLAANPAVLSNHLFMWAVWIDSRQ